MSLTLDDLMTFMKRDKEERAMEREKDKQELKQLISKGVKDEVEAAIEPIKEKQVQLEQVQTDMQNGFSEVMAEVKNIKEQLANKGQSQVWSSSSVGQFVGQPYAAEPVAANGVDDKMTEVISLGRRTVGLFKIDQSDLDRMRQEQFGGAKSGDEEKLLAVEEFLKCEMKFDREAIEQMEIERVFPPAKKSNPQYLYVTFKHERSVTLIYQRTRCLRKESRVLIYIPMQFHDRYDLAGLEYKLRKFENYQTRIKWGWRDLELYKKIRGTEKWQKVDLPEGLRKVDMNPRRSSITLSPAPGRPSQDPSQGEKRGRKASGSPQGQNTPKSVRQETVIDLTKERNKERDEAWKENIENAKLVGEATISPVGDNEGLKKRLDRGLITSVTGTPAKPSFLLDSHSSPILCKSNKNISAN